jgi:hypothetical protein
MCTEVHAFTGEYIELCALIERWAVPVIAKADGPSKVPSMLGPKVERLKTLAEKNTVFCKPESMKKLIARLSPHVKLRGQLAHAINHKGEFQNGTVVIFENADISSPSRVDDRFWLTLEDMPKLLSELRNIRKELADQKLKPAVPPIGLPDHSPHAGPALGQPSASGTSAPSHS